MIQLRERAWRWAVTDFVLMILLGIAIWVTIYWLANGGVIPIEL